MKSKLVSETLSKLSDQGVTRLEYFHCDHFEPWRLGVRESYAEDVARFNELTQQLWYTKRLTLFYKPQVSYALFDGAVPPNVQAVSGEQVGFLNETPEQAQMSHEAIAPLVTSGHEFQLHVHHEGFTQSDVGHDPKVRAWLEAHGSEEADEARLELALRLYLERARAHTGLPMTQWHFVHGNWALNGSDPRICRISNEIGILQDQGCVGDFTFPAGRNMTDPFISDTPYTVKHVRAVKGYDTPAATPLPLDDQDARAPGRFFIWNSNVKHPYTSIDYASLAVRRSHWDPEDIAVRWLRGAPIYDGRAYIKTYAHSMFKEYWEQIRFPVIPHHWPSVQLVFEMLGEACASQGIEFHLTTANEVYETLMTGAVPVQTPALDVSDPDPRYVAVPNAAKGRPSDEGVMLEAMAEKWKDRATRAEAVAIAENLFETYGTRQAGKRAGTAYLNGQVVGRDLEKAYYYLSSSVHNTDPGVLRQRAEILLNDQFSAPDRIKAIEFLTSAAVGGDAAARAQLKALENPPELVRKPDPDLPSTARIKAADKVVLSVMHDRIERMGVTESGAYNFYQARVNNQTLITDMEASLAQRIVALDPGLQQAHEVGAGVATLSIAMAACGVRTHAIERETRRFEALEEVFIALNAAEPDIGEQLTAAKELFGYKEEEADLRARSVVVATNIIATLTDEQKDFILRGIKQYRYAIIDVQRFLVMRNTPAEHEELFASLVKDGFSTPVPVLDHGMAGRYYAISTDPIRIENGLLIVGEKPAPKPVSAANAPADAARPFDAADAIILQVMRDRLRDMGETESGAYGFYKRRVEAGAMVTPAEARLAARLLEADPDLSHMHEIGAGIGTFSIALAASGVHSLAIEKDRRRYGAMEAIQAQLHKDAPQTGAHFEIAQEFFGYREDEAQARARAIVVSTNLVATLSDEQQADILRGMAQYRYAVVDVQRFVTMRAEAAEFEALFAVFATHGLPERQLLLDNGKSGQYYLFSAHPIRLEEGRIVCDAPAPEDAPSSGPSPQQDERARLVEEAELWGYFKSSIKSRPDLWRGKRVLDIGMGGGPHCVPFIVGGAEAYIGVDPLVGTDHVRDFRAQKDPTATPYHAFPWDKDEIMALMPEVTLLPGTLEERADEVRNIKADFAMMSAVTEHLSDPASVFETIWHALEPGGLLWYSHNNYYSWTGHHRHPRSVAQYDPSNEAHNSVIDWRHLEPDHPDYNNPNFNRTRLEDMRALTSKYFEIIEWKLALAAIERLTPEIRNRYSKYTLEELLSQVVYVTARRRDVPLDTDLSDMQFHHPALEYKADADYSGEDIDEYRLINMVYFSKPNRIISHSTNNFAGARLFEKMAPGETVVMTKGEKRLEYTVKDVRTNDKGQAWLQVEEDLDPDILATSYDQWRATRAKPAAPKPPALTPPEGARYVFIDGGAYLGQSSRAFMDTEVYKAKDWEIFAFEAHPELCALIKDLPGVTIQNKALWISDGTIEFYPTGIRKKYELGAKDGLTPGQGSSVMREKVTGDLQLDAPLSVPSLDLSHWIKTSFAPSDVIILKLDVEGAEFDILERMIADGALEYVDWLFIEFHAEKVGKALSEETRLCQAIEAAGVQVVIDAEGQATGDWFRNSGLGDAVLGR